MSKLFRFGVSGTEVRGIRNWLNFISVYEQDVTHVLETLNTDSNIYNTHRVQQFSAANRLLG